jgi:uncharacterized membrane protein YphA (DoxX/SURF4 family)
MFGRRFYGLAAILMGAVGFAFLYFIKAVPPAPPRPEWRELFGVASYALMILGGIAITLAPRIARVGALVLAAVYTAMALVLAGPEVLKGPTVWVNYEDLALTMAEAMGGLAAWSLLGDDAKRGLAGKIARVVLGLCVFVNGGAHFAYLKYTAALVPAGLPPGQIIWAEITGALQIAAALALVSGVQARLAALLLTVLWTIFGLLVWIPHVMQDPHKHSNWTEFASNWVLVGAAWCVTEALAKARARD